MSHITQQLKPGQTQPNLTSQIKTFQTTAEKPAFIYTKLQVDGEEKIVLKLANSNANLYIPNNIYLGGDVIYTASSVISALEDKIADLEARLDALENP